MDTGHFYYITDQYFADFPDPYLERNKETVDGDLHDRPCFYAFKDSHTGLFWMIPFSSQTSKYHIVFDRKMARFHRCDTIAFGHILGHEKAFLIQNMCPVTEKYIKNEYVDTVAKIPVRVDGSFEKELVGKARKVLALQRSGKKVIFPDVLAIERILLSEVDGGTDMPMSDSI
ncbi:MAG: hypothetical protein KBS76_06720 [Ruminococcus sp.]|nr:hypothetical protein [Candidatus Apopatosoma intestinale]